MSASWKPSQRFYELAETRGIPREWCGHQISEFKLYWIERGTLGCWDSTFLNRVDRLWDKVDKSRYYRQEVKISTWSDNCLEDREYPNIVSNQSTTAPPLSLEARTRIADTYMKELKI